MRFTLHDLGLLDAPPEKEFDNLTSLASEMLKVPSAHVSVLDRVNNRIFYKSQTGHPDALAQARELPMNITYCQHVALTEAAVVVPDAREHPLLKGTPALSDGQPLAYLGIPIEAPGGSVIGGLCQMQPEVRVWSDTEIAQATKLAACVTDLIRLRAAMLTSERLRSEQRDFTYSISHDLLSPANTVRMILDEVTLEQDQLSEDTRDLVGAATGTLDRMRTQIADVLAYSQTLGHKAEFGAVDLNSVMADIRHDLKGAIDNGNVVIDCGPLPIVRGNSMQLRALFQNLVANAMKFSRPGICSVIRIQSGHCDAINEHSITFKDNGIGIAPENQAKVFELFNRLNLRDAYEGTGIGLTLCRRVAENHDGSIMLRSDGQTGTTFTVRLPEMVQ